MRGKATSGTDTTGNLLWSKLLSLPLQHLSNAQIWDPQQVNVNNIISIANIAADLFQETTFRAQITLCRAQLHGVDWISSPLQSVQHWLQKDIGRQGAHMLPHRRGAQGVCRTPGKDRKGGGEVRFLRCIFWLGLVRVGFLLVSWIQWKDWVGVLASGGLVPLVQSSPCWTVRPSKGSEVSALP